MFGYSPASAIALLAGAPVAGDLFGDAQPRVSIAVAGMHADTGIVHVFGQRHVAHHAHGAEDLGGVLGGLHHRLRREHLRDGGERQIGQAAVGHRLRMIGSPGRLPDRRARAISSLIAISPSLVPIA